MILNLGIKCPSCGKWKRFSTSNVSKAKTICFSCGRNINFRDSKGRTVDHIDLNKEELRDIPENIVIANLNCSKTKNDIL